MGRSKTYRYGVNVRATNYSGVTDELKKKIDKKITSIANRVKKNNGKVKAGLKTKGFFFIMRMIQKSGWNEADKITGQNEVGTVKTDRGKIHKEMF